VKKRDPYLSAAASFFFPGLGQVYCGRILRGIVYLLPAFLLMLLDFFYVFVAAGSYRGMNLWVLFDAPISQIVQLFVRIIATYDAYNIARTTETEKPDNNSIA
jgi:TM2 domain-containing membrane protein YozV